MHVVVNPYKRLRDVLEQEFALHGVIVAYIIRYAHNVSIIEQMIRPLFVGYPVGEHDRILAVSTAVSGASFFVPDRKSVV